MELLFVCDTFNHIHQSFSCLSVLLQHGVPAFTVSQPDEAMHVLEEKASQLDVSCIVISSVSFVSHTVGMCMTMN